MGGIQIGNKFVNFDDDDGYKSRVERRMARIDALTPEQRMVIHEYGWCLVETFLAHGVKSPRSMRSLINAVKRYVIDRKDLP